jgi:hypothetical protein
VPTVRLSEGGRLAGFSALTVVWQNPNRSVDMLRMSKGVQLRIGFGDTWNLLTTGESVSNFQSFSPRY